MQGDNNVLWLRKMTGLIFGKNTDAKGDQVTHRILQLHSCSVCLNMCAFYVILAVMLLFIIKLLDTFVLRDAVCEYFTNFIYILQFYILYFTTEPIKIKFLLQYQGVFFLAKPGPSAEQ